MNVKEMCGQIDYLVSVKTNLCLHLQEYSPDEITVEYDDGSLYAEWANHTPVEATSHGTVLILGTEYRAYVAQQVRFTPEQE